MTESSLIKIKAMSRHNGLFITLMGTILLVIIISISSFYWQQFRFPLLFLILVSLVTIFIGLLKLAEPKHSLIFSPKTLLFYHRHGQWQLPWLCIRNIFPVTNTYGVNKVSLNYVGIRLEKLQNIQNKITPRLANRLIHEQKPIIEYCIKHQLISFDQGIINFEPFIFDNGEVIKGPIAAFLYQSDILFAALGAHLFIPRTSLNTDIEDFVQLANSYAKYHRNIEQESLHELERKKNGR